MRKREKQSANILFSVFVLLVYFLGDIFCILPAVMSNSLLSIPQCLPFTPRYFFKNLFDYFNNYYF
jgi:hypothetical protein